MNKKLERLTAYDFNIALVGLEFLVNEATKWSALSQGDLETQKRCRTIIRRAKPVLNKLKQRIK